MENFVINGQRLLSGTVNISGAKNAILPIMTATILASGKFELSNVPKLLDIRSMTELLQHLGAKVHLADGVLSINTTTLNQIEAPYELVNKMRASIWVLGPLLARFKKAIVSFPGGCAIGTRPVDLHLKAMHALGAEMRVEAGNIIAECPGGLKGATIEFPFISVGASANAIMAATLAIGKSIIKNIALEPEIDSLITFLIQMGAKIEKKNINDVEVIGVPELIPTNMKMIPDRIEAGTLLLAAAITKSPLTITNCDPIHLKALMDRMERSGCKFIVKEDTITLNPAMNIMPVDLITETYPGFPTDLQAQFMAYMCLSEGESQIEETIFPDRFMHVAELNRLGANISVKGGIATIKGVEELSGAKVVATDLRASAALVLAGLAAKGKTTISEIHHIDRGYEKIEKKLNGVGADIVRFKSK